jgi:hypothetical protein
MKEAVEIVPLREKNNDTTSIAQDFHLVNICSYLKNSISSHLNTIYLDTVPPSNNNKTSPSFFHDYQPQSHAVDDEGNTPLHRVIINFSELEIRLLLIRTKRKAVCKMARSVNNKGELPLDLVIRMPDSNLKETIISLLWPFTVDSPLKKLSELIDSKTVIERYNFSPSSTIVKNLQIACAVVNEIRSKITASSSHPDMNTWSEEEKHTLVCKINQMRISEVNGFRILLSKLLGIVFDTSYILYEEMAKKPLQYGIGNCWELTIVALYYLSNIDKNLFAHAYSIKNGDHAFVIIGEAENAVVCDAWAGEVYPAYEIFSKMGDHKKYTRFSSAFQVITTYNPKFHSIDQYLLKPIVNNISCFVITTSVKIEKFDSLIGNIDVDSSRMAQSR